MYEYVASRDEIRKFMFSGHERLATAFSADRLVRAQFVHSQRQAIGAEMSLLRCDRT